MKALPPLLERGQALVEFVLAAPLLILLIIGMFQFSILFLARVQFEHACGEAGREYAAGLVSQASISDVIWKNFGNYQIFFNRDSLQLSQQKASSPFGSASSALGQTLQGLTSIMRSVPAGGSVLNYEGPQWTVVIRTAASPLFTNGITFQTQFSVLRHPRISS